MIDKERCSELFRRYHDMVFGFCLGRLRDSDAADCTQEVFLTLLKKREKLIFSEKLPTWLMGAADRICRKYRRKNSAILLDIDEFSDRIPDPTCPADQPLSEELYAILSREEADLLMEYYGASHGDRRKIADKLGISTNALCQRIKRIRSRIVRYFDENDS